MKKELLFLSRPVLLLISMIFWGLASFSQVPPVGKYDTTSYPKDRKAIDELSRRINFVDSSVYYNDDYIAVGPEGKVSYGFNEWRAGFINNGATFKSVRPVSGATVLRVYNGDAAVRNSILNVVFDTPNGELTITVVRTETFIKRKGKWYFVAGQGTRVMSKEELEETMKKSMKN
ncbi:MAG: hypothetical protein JST09_02095 [Bacteroidetes bacterium]|nr:hypothetical protein [Bacteroidota bacterium]